MGGHGGSPFEISAGLRRNCSNNTMDSERTRSRGISGVSGDLAMNQTQTSHSSNDRDSSQLLRQHHNTVADKVRSVHIAE